MKTVFINLKEDDIISSQEVPLNYIHKIDSSFVDVINYFKEDELSVLFQLDHNQSNTTLYLTDVSPYILLFFDEELEFKSASYSNKSGSGNFTIQTQYKNILFIRIPYDLKWNKIINLNF